jgi:tetratricopeptide (TPR) repeat protein
MTIPRLLGLLALVAAAALAIVVSQLNRDPAELILPGLPPFAAPLWVILFLAVLAGGLFATAYIAALSSRDALDRWRQERLERRNARVDRLQAEAVAAFLAGEIERARERFAEVNELAPSRGEAWLFAGDAARHAGDLEAASELHLRAQGLMPDDPRVLDALARDSEKSGDLGRAQRYQEQLIERHGATPKRRERQRDLAIEANDWELALRAEQECSRGRRRTAEEERILRGLQFEAAAVTAAAGDEEGALLATRRLVNEVPAFEPGYSLIAEIERSRGNPEAAAEALEQGVAATESLELVRRLVSLRLDLEQPEAAIDSLRETVERFADDAAIAARILLGRLYYRVGLVEEAEAEFAALADLAESSPVVEYYRARAGHRRGDTDAAYRILRDAIRADGYLDIRYVCGECGTAHDRYASRCSGCGRWNQVAMDISRDAHAAEPVRAPVV